jgi:hypothetical protein
MLTKELITEVKNYNTLNNLIQKQVDTKSIIYILENLGRLPKNFDGDFLVNLFKFYTQSYKTQTQKLNARDYSIYPSWQGK